MAACTVLAGASTHVTLPHVLQVRVNFIVERVVHGDVRAGIGVDAACMAHEGRAMAIAVRVAVGEEQIGVDHLMLTTPHEHTCRHTSTHAGTQLYVCVAVSMTEDTTSCRCTAARTSSVFTKSLRGLSFNRGALNRIEHKRPWPSNTHKPAHLLIDTRASEHHVLLRAWQRVVPGHARAPP